MLTMDDATAVSAETVRAVREDRIESWAWFLQLLEEHGYKDQPIWDDAERIAREVGWRRCR